MIAAITNQDIVYFGMILFLVFLGLVAIFIFQWFTGEAKTSPSPYSGFPLRRASDISMMTREEVYKYLFKNQDYYNKMFDLHRSAICRETGRIFPDCMTWYGNIEVDWTFLTKRHKGAWVSWGSLSEEQKVIMHDRHPSMAGFQTEYSSKKPSPLHIEKEYALMRPGPLYVDLNTGTLLGWKEVPGTELEILVVQKPMERYLPGVDSKYD